MASINVQELDFSTPTIPVSVVSLIPVQPVDSIPVNWGDSLYLSNLDDIVGARVFTPTVYFYRANNCSPSKSVLKTLRDALAKVLVPYYPFSGRLREAENGKLEVFFGPQQGALMVEAYSDMALAEFGDLQVPNPGWTPLVYRFPDEEPYKVLEMPLVIAQVTLFRCGSFSLGLRICHCICDGLGAMQFLSSWAATARSGSLVTNPVPCWDREIFKPREPPSANYPHIEFMKVEDGSSLSMSLWQEKPVQRCYRIDREFQARVKALAQTEGNAGCSTFDSMAAHIWRSWVRALQVKPLDYMLRLTFSVNVRHKVKNPLLKDGFYGNVVCTACAVSSVFDLHNAEICETANLITKARVGVTEDYVRSTIDYVEMNRPRRLEFGGKLTITQWTRFALYESADFGWGRPIYAGPIDLTPTPQVCVFLPEADAVDSGSMIVCICLPAKATSKFQEYFSSLH